MRRPALRSRPPIRATSGPRTPSTWARSRGVGRIHQQTFIDMYSSRPRRGCTLDTVVCGLLDQWFGVRPTDPRVPAESVPRGPSESRAGIAYGMYHDHRTIPTTDCQWGTYATLGLRTELQRPTSALGAFKARHVLYCPLPASLLTDGKASFVSTSSVRPRRKVARARGARRDG